MLYIAYNYMILALYERIWNILLEKNTWKNIIDYFNTDSFSSLYKPIKRMLSSFHIEFTFLHINGEYFKRELRI